MDTWRTGAREAVFTATVQVAFTAVAALISGAHLRVPRLTVPARITLDNNSNNNYYYYNLLHSILLLLIITTENLLITPITF